MSSSHDSLIPPSPYTQGVRLRRAVLGDKYVDDALVKGTTDYWRPAQQFMTEIAWGTIWTRDGLQKRDRSLIST